jgi:ATP-dependent Clp protease ATP-binding subunit ClpB
VKRLEKEKDIILDITDNAKDFLAKMWWDPVFGARPLKRAIQTYLLNKLSLDIISGKIKDSDKVKVKKSDNELIFEVQNDK